ncbi:MAG: ATP-binding domain-containing protein, partial [Sterolibacterium sp.]|nr:ATP-binding domain-containing protein [Sterolibacterium sp.]
VQLMTVHAAKGLEFNAVFLSGLEEGLFPHENAMLETRGLEEERRLMYVAVTRARQRLYLSHAQTRMLHGQTRYNIPSRFLDEIPEPLLKRLNPPATARSSGSSLRTATATGSALPGHPRPLAARNPSGLSIGQNIEHAKFGRGIITNAEGAGTDARVQVKFDDCGSKWLALSVAKLTPL